MGRLFRRYWHPIAASVELDEQATKAVRVLGEDLVLYKDRSGAYGLIDRSCAHRRVDLSYGIPEENGLRCMYHGWLYDETGQCTEQPFEETVHTDARFKQKVKVTAYPVRDVHGMLWTYMGPEPAPLIPNWEPFTWDNCFHNIAIAELPCNWLQCQENSIDPVHLEWLHGYWATLQERKRAKRLGAEPDRTLIVPKRHLKIGFDVFEHGIIKRRVSEGTTEEDQDWKVGHPALFPNALLVGDAVKGNLQFRTPIDDTHTLHVSWYFFKAAPGHHVPAQERIPFYRVPWQDESGRLIIDTVNNQDFTAWIAQGPLFARDQEKLGESDRGVVLFRRLLEEQLHVMDDGGDPMNVIRDPERNHAITLPLEPWPALQDPSLLASYEPGQAGEPPEQESAIRQVLGTWASVGPVGTGAVP